MSTTKKRQGISYSIWVKKRFQILKDQQFLCANCLKDLLQEGEYHCHRIDGNPRNNRLTNLLVLCKPCHRKLHHARSFQQPE